MYFTNTLHNTGLKLKLPSEYFYLIKSAMFVSFSCYFLNTIFYIMFDFCFFFRKMKFIFRSKVFLSFLIKHCLLQCKSADFVHRRMLTWINSCKTKEIYQKKINANKKMQCYNRLNMKLDIWESWLVDTHITLDCE